MTGSGARGQVRRLLRSSPPARGRCGLAPGSHHPEQDARLAAYGKRRGRVRDAAESAVYQASFPGYVAATSPGDVISFDLHAWHGAGGRDRLAWNAVYLRCPETDDERDRTLRYAHDGFEQAFGGLRRDRYPVWRDWLARRRRPSPVLERMRRAGVLGCPARWKAGKQRDPYRHLAAIPADRLRARFRSACQPRPRCRQ